VDCSDHSYDDGLELLMRLIETHHHQQAQAEDDVAAIVLASLPRLVTCIQAISSSRSYDLLPTCIGTLSCYIQSRKCVVRGHACD
jgi:hypothetical protein